jgi:hypothetical protein
VILSPQEIIFSSAVKPSWRGLRFRKLPSSVIASRSNCDPIFLRESVSMERQARSNAHRDDFSVEDEEHTSGAKKGCQEGQKPPK